MDLQMWNLREFMPHIFLPTHDVFFLCAGNSIITDQDRINARAFKLSACQICLGTPSTKSIYIWQFLDIDSEYVLCVGLLFYRS